MKISGSVLSAVGTILLGCSGNGGTELLDEEPLDLTQPMSKQTADLCSPDRFQAQGPSPISCCQDGNRTWHTNDGKLLGYRVFANPCTEADGESTNCSGIGCTYGPCGARIEWAVTAAEVHIFRPVSMPQKCGWAVKDTVACRPGTCDWPAGADRDFPEPFTDQDEYEGVTAGCPFRDCAVGGIPTL
jgi:hypothetical protein